MKTLSVFGAFRFSEFRIRDCVPVIASKVKSKTVPLRHATVKGEKVLVPFFLTLH
jgi:hypothetical protein